MSDVIYVTKETLEQLKAELQRMRTVDRPAASKAIAEAREKGDLKENAEYDAAKEAQGLLVQISSEPAVAPGYILAGLSVLHRGDTSGASMKVSCSLSFNRACSDLTSRNSGFRNLSSADRAPREDMK